MYFSWDFSLLILFFGLYHVIDYLTSLEISIRAINDEKGISYPLGQYWENMVKYFMRQAREFETLISLGAFNIREKA